MGFDIRTILTNQEKKFSLERSKAKDYLKKKKSNDKEQKWKPHAFTVS